jgi:diguanylate cyclase (GGDEF)-like protein
MDWVRSRHDLDDERVLIGVTGGVLWLVGAIAGVVAQLMPGAHEIDLPLFLGLAVGIMGYGLWSISGVFDWSKVSVTQHACATAALTPLLGVVLWATGGQHSYLLPLMVLPLLHIAYFFRWQVSLPLTIELILVSGSPILYESEIADGSLSRLVTFAAVALMVVTVLRTLKGRLVAAEAEQRQIAQLDALTGLANRRRFDEALDAAVAAAGDPAAGRRGADARSFAIVLFDLDRFKLVNDTYGHPAGDRLLRAVAAACAAIVRPGDTLARIGGDEFAVIAPTAGEDGARRLAEELGRAVRSAGAEATVAWAVHPADGEDGDALLRIADRRLYERKAALIRA